jgi:hypothetical protein
MSSAISIITPDQIFVGRSWSWCRSSVTFCLASTADAQKNRVKAA